MGTVQELAKELHISPKEVCQHLAGLGLRKNWDHLEPTFETALRDHLMDKLTQPKF